MPYVSSMAVISCALHLIHPTYILFTNSDNNNVILTTMSTVVTYNFYNVSSMLLIIYKFLSIAINQCVPVTFVEDANTNVLCIVMLMQQHYRSIVVSSRSIMGLVFALALATLWKLVIYLQVRIIMLINCF